MEILGKVAGLNRNQNKNHDILISEHEDGYINIVIRNPEMFDIDDMLFGFEDGKMYFLDGGMDERALHVTRKKNRYVKTKNPAIKAYLGKCVGGYKSKYSKAKKAFYITLKEEK